MKRLICSILFILSVCCISAQDKYPVYCNLICFNEHNIGKCNVLIDMGVYATGTLIDENNKEIKFGSLVAAANYMVKRGWRVVSVYSVEFKTPFDTPFRNVSGFATNYVLEKMVSSDAESFEGLKIWYKNTKAREEYESKIANK